MAFHRSESLGFVTNHLARIMEQALQRRLKPLGLSTGYFPALLELWEEDGLTQKALVSRLNIEQATIANTLSRMERDGLIRREPDPEDGRSRRIRLTGTGRSAQAPAVAAAEAVNAEMLAPLPEEERRRLVSSIGAVVGAAVKRGA
ncbi:MarR family winged helix-turn-helix transcriptional regulator [Tropicimonas sp.]|uniref:MarR family winged helix-turn-helix transcriptional regulator n=1 Tax=Tropicimonas sp. TaxID=2067044 RepID=UPI003A8A2787